MLIEAKTCQQKYDW